MADVGQIGYNGPDGATFGRAATEKISFYGVTPVVQAATLSLVTTTSATSTTAAYGFTTAAQADAVVSNLNAITTALINIGVLAAS